MMKNRKDLQKRLTGIIACCVLVTFTAVFAREVANSRKAIEATTTNLEENVGALFSQPTLELPETYVTPTKKPKPTKKAKSTAKYHKPANGKVIKGYSKNDLQYDKTMKDWRTHEGLDYSGANGNNIYAVASGTIKEVGMSEMYGSYIILKFGDIEARYYNLAKNTKVKKGDKVKKGQIIGQIGNTGAFETGDGSHLHFETWQNKRSFNLFK